MSRMNLIDCFPAFLGFWERARGQPVDAQIEAWASAYMASWPDLLHKLQQDYASQDADWRQIARERVFPTLDQRLRDMQVAHDCLIEICPSVHLRAQERLGLQIEVCFVIYVGIGCGAGWVTEYRGTPAVLFGLENVAEEGWADFQTLSGLVAHEIGHVAHAHWRKGRGCSQGKGPWWQLYEEGFAQRCEHEIAGQETWHMASGSQAGEWLAWCQAHRGWLAAEYLRAVEAQASLRPFFGSWYDIQGWKQCGYYLGHEAVRQLAKGMSLQEIALLADYAERLADVLRAFARQ